MNLEDLPTLTGWRGPPIDAATAKRHYRYYLKYAGFLSVRSIVYRRYFIFDEWAHGQLIVSFCHGLLGRPYPEDVWHMTIPEEDEAGDGDWQNPEEPIFVVPDPLNAFLLARIIISEEVCWAVQRMMVCMTRQQVYNMGTGGPGGRIKT